MSKFAWIALLLPALALTDSTHASEFPPQIQAGEHRLVLNGWGTRSNAFLNLYEAGLYLSQPSRDARTIAAANEAMALRIKITSSFVSQAKLVASLEEGFEKSTGGNTAPIKTHIDQFRNCFKDAITKGDIFDIVYVPAHGVIVNKNGRLKGVVAGTEFKQHLFNIWLSDNPADKDLRQALLTQPAVR